MLIYIYTWQIVFLNFVLNSRGYKKETHAYWELIPLSIVICVHTVMILRDIEKRTRTKILFYYISPHRIYTHIHHTSARWQNFNSVHTTAGCAVVDTAAYHSVVYKERLHAYVQFSLQERAIVVRENFLRPKILTIEPTIDRVCLPREKACGSRRHQRTAAE